MIEYHRLKGNQTMVFWRFSLRQFARFVPGDLVFFIDRRARHPYTQEKGIIGYGRCKEIRNNSIKQVWNKHESNTGYRNYKEFTNAIRFYRKNDHRLPNQIQTIELENVLFFQTPIFLSEVGIELSDQLESFTYLEREGMDLSTELLKLAKQIGLDEWMISQNENISLSNVEHDYKEQLVRNKLSTIQAPYIKEQFRQIKNHTESVAVGNIHYQYSNNRICIYLSMTSKNQFFSLVGLKTLIDKILETSEIDYFLLTSLTLDEAMLMNLALLNLELVQI